MYTEGGAVCTINPKEQQQVLREAGDNDIALRGVAQPQAIPGPLQQPVVQLGKRAPPRAPPPAPSVPQAVGARLDQMAFSVDDAVQSTEDNLLSEIERMRQ